jgi:uroporphyrin-III C-methyltransferase / precorrin-2 dehydrogenase / sirohydrochlorin ferrochelatase
MRYFPIFLDFEGQRVLVVGGGEAILNKVRLLQRTSASIELVAETLHPGLDGLVSHGAVAWVGRRFEPARLDGVVAVFAAADDITNKPSSRRRATATCRSTSSTGPICRRFSPRRSSIAIRSSSPSAPRAPDRCWPRGCGRASRPCCPIASASSPLPPAALRDRVARAIAAGPGRRAFWSSYFFGPAAEAFLAGDQARYGAAVDAAIDEAAARAPAGCRSSPRPPIPELLTLKAHRKLQEADVIVHDRGADPRILDYARRDAARVAVERPPPGPAVAPGAKGATWCA